MYTIHTGQRCMCWQSSRKCCVDRQQVYTVTRLILRPYEPQTVDLYCSWTNCWYLELTIYWMHGVYKVPKTRQKGVKTGLVSFPSLKIPPISILRTLSQSSVCTHCAYINAPNIRWAVMLLFCIKTTVFLNCSSHWRDIFLSIMGMWRFLSWRQHVCRASLISNVMIRIDTQMSRKLKFSLRWYLHPPDKTPLRRHNNKCKNL